MATVTTSLVAELRVVPVAEGRWHWRWDLIWYRPTDPVNQGVFDGRAHARADFGYTRTRWGAWRQVREAYEHELRRA
jgi:hypothetical protein